MNQHQQQLPFATAEGSFAERKALLWVALRECGAGPQLIRFAEWLFEATAGGLGEPITATYRELATKPWLLNCSKSTLKRTVTEGVSAGLVIAEEVWDAVGRPAGSRYALDLATVRDLITRASGRPTSTQKNEPVRVQDEPLTVHDGPLRVQNDPIKRGSCDTQPAALIPGGETPRAQCPRTRAPNEPMNNVPTIPKKSEPTPMQRSLVSPVDPGRATAEPAHASQAVAELVGRLPTPEEYAVRREALKARIQRTIADPQCHDSLAGRAADLVVLHGVPVSQVDAILDSLVRARRQNAIKKGSAGAYANGAFGRLARRHGIDWGKADDG